MTMEAETKVTWLQIRIAGSYQKLGEARNTYPSEAQEAERQCSHLDSGPMTLISDLWSPDL